MRRRGFTLIELLVVIAIIAILAAILFPVFARARAKAQANTCLSNVKQMTLAMLMYVQDYDEMFPAYASNYSPQDLYDRKLAPYIKNQQIYACPSHSDGGTQQWYGFCYSYAWVVKSDSCRGTNWNATGIIAIGLNWGWYPVVGLKTLDDPVNQIMLADGTPNGWYFCYGISEGYPYSWAGLDTRHSDGVNSGWADGHAKFVGTGPRPPCSWSGPPGCPWFPIPERYFTWAAD